MSILPISTLDKKAEYDTCAANLESERSMVWSERNRRRKRVPKPGYYSLGFSEYTMAQVPCTLTLSELRKDLSFCSVPPANLSIYFEEKISNNCMLQSKVAQRSQKQVLDRSPRHRAVSSKQRRPRSAAEEQRQLESAIRQSIAEIQSSTVPAQPREPEPRPARSTLFIAAGDSVCGRQASILAASVLRGLR